MSDESTAMPRTTIACLLAAVLFAAPSFTVYAAPDYAEARDALREAMAASDHEAALRHVKVALAQRPNAPYLLGTLATIQARLGQPEAAMETLRVLTDLGVRVDVSEHEGFAAVRTLDGWAGVAAHQAALDEPVGDFSVAARFDEPTFVPEGVAVDAQGRFYLGSIRHGRIVRLDGDNAENLVEAGTMGLASVFGLRFHQSSGLLWATTAVVPQAAEPDQARAGRSGILRFRLDDGEPVDAHWLPEDGAKHILGDLVLLDEHRAVATDSLTGAVVQLDTRSGEFTRLLEPGRLPSPQGLVRDGERGAWFIADWAGGLFRLDIATGELERVSAGPGVMLYGIDGLYAHRGDLIAVQNLAPPHRVTRIRLDENGRAATAQQTVARALPQFDEPTLGTLREGVLYLNANSHWNRFTAENDLPDEANLTGPIVLRIPLNP